MEISINDGWVFTKKFFDELLNEEYDTSNLEHVRIPHTVCETPFNYFDASEYQMVSGYRYDFDYDKRLSGRRVFVEFQGIAHRSVIFFNGKKLYEHHCGYTAFQVELTDYLKTGKNSIVVECDSRESINQPPFGNVVDYMTYGGIYRGVSIKVTGMTYIEDVFVTTTNIFDEEKTFISKIKLNRKNSCKITENTSKNDVGIIIENTSKNDAGIITENTSKNDEGIITENVSNDNASTKSVDIDDNLKIGIAIYKHGMNYQSINGSGNVADESTYSEITKSTNLLKRFTSVAVCDELNSDGKCEGKVNELNPDGKYEGKASELNSDSKCSKDEINMQIIKSVKEVDIWSLNNPNLYDVKYTLYNEKTDEVLDEKIVCIGFRTAEFTKAGFYLNGEKIKLRGLNRHQSYPYVGYAMPKSMQEYDVSIMKRELGLNAVRTSHYPQSKHFYNACDEMGLLVFTEIPGWQHIGDESWKQEAIKNVEDMVIQNRNHPSIILWGVRINESPDDHEFYVRTNEAARRLDPTRQTGGVRCITKSELLEDVYTYNDFIHDGTNDAISRKKKVVRNEKSPYLISEYCGHMYPTKSFDCEEHMLEHALRHARVIDSVAGTDGVAGSFGWCFTDYNTHKDFGSGDRICYHGVMDMFRNKKLAAYSYMSQKEGACVMELSSSMDIGEHPASRLGNIYMFTNADSIRIYKNDEFIKEYIVGKDGKKGELFDNLSHPPFLVDDFIGNKLVENEGYSVGKSERIKKLIKAYSDYGMNHLPFKTILLALRVIIIDRVKFSEGLEIFNKYVGNWGNKVTTYKFEGIKDGKVVKTLTKAPLKKVNYRIDVSHKDMKEEESYDVAAVRIVATDEYDNVIRFYHEPLILKAEGSIEIVGPKVLSLKGGMGGTYVRSVRGGKGTLTIATENDIIKRIDFYVKQKEKF